MPKQTNKTNQSKSKRFWNFTQVPGSPPELILYGDISSESWWGDEITPQEFSDDLKALGDVPEIVVRINSGGGDVFAANAIYARLKDHPAKITVKIDGWAASAATIIANAGDVVMIPENGYYMIHDPAYALFGYYQECDLEKMQAELAVIKSGIVAGYVAKTGKTAEEISALMKREAWFKGAEAVEEGFCDEVMFSTVQTVQNATHVIVNKIDVGVERYRTIPKDVLKNAGCGGENTKPKGKESEDVTMAEIRTVDELRAEYPELTTQIATDAATAERNRIKGIEDVALEGFESIVQAAKYDKPVDAGAVAVAIVNEQKKKGADYLNGRATDAAAKDGANGVGTEDGKGGAGSERAEIDAAIDSVFPKK